VIKKIKSIAISKELDEGHVRLYAEASIEIEEVSQTIRQEVMYLTKTLLQIGFTAQEIMDAKT
jgi:predicted amino acid-binding ACT domain protein